MKKKHSMLSRLLSEWLTVFVCLAIGIGWLSSTHWMTLANYYLYDRLLSSYSRAADDRIVLIQFDERSFADLGRWPWNRQVHAKMFEKLAAEQPLSVLFDVILTEPSANPEDDRVMASAMSKNSHLSIPILMEDDGQNALKTTLPVSPLPTIAQLGHIAILPDDDGVVRSVSMQQTDNQSKQWPLLTRTLLDESNLNDSDLENNQLTIPFNVPQNAYLSFSYVDLLNGQIPKDFLKGKYVLIGATATGLGDQYPTPSSGHYSTMPGIEIHANILDALLNNFAIRTINAPWLRATLSVVPVGGLLILLLFLRERYHLLGFSLFMCAYVALISGLLWFHYFWLPPATSLIGLALSYVVWSWRRLVVMLHHVTTEMTHLNQQTGELSKLLPVVSKISHKHLFQPHALELDIAHIQHLEKFISNSVQLLPVGLIFTDLNGRILMHNEHATLVLNQDVNGLNIRQVLTEIDSNISACLSEIDQDWNQLQNREVHGRNGQIFQLNVIPIQFSLPSQVMPNTIWQISLIDLSNERAAQKQRNDLITFMSHDLRTPQVGILSLIQLYNSSNGAMTDADLTAQISTKVRSTLNAAGDLVLLARAQDTNNYTMIEINFVDIVYSAVEQVWAQASAKNITLKIDKAMNEIYEHLWLLADGAMLTRALMNLLTNSIRYSAENTEVNLSVAYTVTELICFVQDHGQGMSAKHLSQLNASIRTINQYNHTSAPDEAGSLSIGLHMVAAVIEHHSGRIYFEGSVGKGTSITITLPKLDAN